MSAATSTPKGSLASTTSSHSTTTSASASEQSTSSGGSATSASYVYITGGFSPTAAASAMSSAAIPSSAGSVAGIAVGSVAGAFILVGLIFLLCRRRPRRYRHGDCQGSPAKSWSETSSFRPLNKSLALPDPDRPRTWFQTPWLNAEHSPFHLYAQPPEIGTRLSPVTPVKVGHRSLWPRSIVRPESVGRALPSRDEKEAHQTSELSMTTTRVDSPVRVLHRPMLSDTSSDDIGECMSEATYSTTFGHGKLADVFEKYENQDEDATHPLVRKNHYSFLRTDPRSDAEAQTPQPSSGRASVASSARASIAAMAASLSRALSIKNRTIPAMPDLSGNSGLPKGSKIVSRYPLTPKYDNGTFEPHLIGHNAQASLPGFPMIDQRHQTTCKPTFSSFVRGSKSRLPASSSQPESQQVHPPGRVHRNAAQLRANTPAQDADKQGLSIRSPNMPAPLTIDKSRMMSESSLTSSLPTLRDVRVLPSVATLHEKCASPKEATIANLSRNELYESDSDVSTLRDVAQPAKLNLGWDGSDMIDDTKARYGKPPPVLPKEHLPQPGSTDMLPLSGLPGSREAPFTVKTPSLLSVYNQHNVPAIKLAPSLPLPPVKRPMRPPPMPVVPGSYQTLAPSYISQERALSMGSALSPDSTEPGRQSMVPRGLFTPSKSETGDLYLTVQFRPSF